MLTLPHISKILNRFLELKYFTREGETARSMAST
ncbi:putative transposase [Wolbachia endosymbiont of Cimex lectularius]|nr:putative transposase [Wolbachia endosymbiont of Cimex lectularius]